MNLQKAMANLPGVQNLIEWFGYWPTFHDAEVVSIELNREGSSRLRVHCFCTTNRVNKYGHYITEKHAIVSFIFEKIAQLELANFNQQNVVSSISVGLSENGYEVILGDCYGVSGRLEAGRLSFEFESGMPSNSIYAETLK